LQLIVPAGVVVRKGVSREKGIFAATPPMSITIARMLDACDRCSWGDGLSFA
jgi:hypothetical protein